MKLGRIVRTLSTLLSLCCAVHVSAQGSEGNAGIDGSTRDATAASLTLPHGMAVDASGNVFVADTHSHRVRKVSAVTGIVTTVAGTGVAGYSGDGSAAANGELNQPSGVALDSAGNLYIADTLNHRIRRVAAQTGIISTVAGTGAEQYSGDNGPATSAALRYPVFVAVDSDGNLYIADSLNNRIRRVDAGTGTISTVAGTGVSGSSGDGGPAAEATLFFPQGLAIGGARLYIADTFNHRVREVDLGTGIIATVAGTGHAGYSGDTDLATRASLSCPWSVAVDAAGNLYIADSVNNRIRAVDARSGVIATIAGIGKAGYSGDDGVARSASLYFPWGVAIDEARNLYIADTFNDRIRKVSGRTGVITTVAGAVSPNIADAQQN